MCVCVCVCPDTFPQSSPPFFLFCLVFLANLISSCETTCARGGISFWRRHYKHAHPEAWAKVSLISTSMGYISKFQEDRYQHLSICSPALPPSRASSFVFYRRSITVRQQVQVGTSYCGTKRCQPFLHSIQQPTLHLQPPLYTFFFFFFCGLQPHNSAGVNTLLKGNEDGFWLDQPNHFWRRSGTHCDHTEHKWKCKGKKKGKEKIDLQSITL